MGWNVDTRLNALSPDVQDCVIWNNPALHFESGTLYLVTECNMFLGASRDPPRSKLSVFSTVPSGPPAGWIWSYRGSFGGFADAQALGADLLIQPSVTHAVDGRLLLVASPATLGSNGQPVDEGCIALSLPSLDSPALVPACSGSAPLLVARLTLPTGAGSCTFAPEGSEGVVYTEVPSPSRFLLHSSLLRP
jgi:hypothetical protein